MGIIDTRRATCDRCGKVESDKLSYDITPYDWALIQVAYGTSSDCGTFKNALNDLALCRECRMGFVDFMYRTR